MVDAIPPFHTTAALPASRRLRHPLQPSFTKQIQHILGPKLATRLNALLFLLFIQSLVLLFLVFTIIAKNRAIVHLAHAPPHSPYARYLEQDDSHFTKPPAEYSKLPDAAVRSAQFDELSPAITGFDKPVRYTSFLGNFITCRPQPCNIDHWPYIGEKCFYRDKKIKDKQGHNSSIWTLLQDEWIYSEDRDFPCPVQICRRQWNEELNYTRQIVLRAMQEHFKNYTPWDTNNMYTGNKYLRVNPFFGLEYTFNGFLTLTRNHSSNRPGANENRTASLIIRRGFTQKYCDVTVYDDVHPREEPVYVIVPFTGRLEQLRTFYNNIKDLLDGGVNLRVVVATHGGPINMLGASELVREMKIGLTEGLLSEGHMIHVIEAPGDSADGNFSRSLALLQGSRFVPAEALMFFCDVDMTIKLPFFDNCRHNTHRGHQVFYPVVYSLYPYGTTISKEHGYWRKGAFGMVCLYKSDFLKSLVWLNTKVQSSLKGWGMEDVMLYRMFALHWRTTVFQAIEPNLLHRWHPKYCKYNNNVAACIGTVLDNMGSQRFLASIVANSGMDLRDIPYKPQPVLFQDYKNGSEESPDRIHEMPAAESASTKTKQAEMQQMYEESIRSGKAGVLSVFAKEAEEAMAITNSQQLQEYDAQRAHVGLVYEGAEETSTTAESSVR